jgi:hypothetical protein
VGEHWTAVSTSEDNVVMVWQPTMHVWAGEEVHVEEKQLEPEEMEGVRTQAQLDLGQGVVQEAGHKARLEVGARAHPEGIWTKADILEE